MLEVSSELSLFVALCAGSLVKFLCMLKSYRQRVKPENAVHAGTVSAINFYPVKSCRAQSVQEAKCTYAGLQYLEQFDRHFMICREDGQFITQRQEPTLAFIRTSYHGNDLHVDAPNMDTLIVPTTDSSRDEKANVLNCRVWGEEVLGMDCGYHAQAWLLLFLGKPYHLVFSTPNLPKRSLSKSGMTKWHKFAKPQDQVAFQDGTPFLLTTEESLNDLASRLDMPIDMRRFRPNIVVTGCPKAFDEDSWREIFIGEAKFSYFKPCDRCSLTTIDPDRGIKDPKGEPLKTLKSYRLKPETGTIPCFGICICTEWEGSIRVGDAVYAVKEE